MRVSERRSSPNRLNMSQVPTNSRNHMKSNRVESQRSMGGPSYPREQQRSGRQPIQTYSQSYTPENRATEIVSGQTYPQTFTTGSRSTETPPSQTSSQSPTAGSRDAGRQLTQTYSQTHTSESQSIGTLNPEPAPPGILSAHYVKPKQTQTPQKYRKDEEVYIRGQYDDSGKPVFRRLRICCIQWSTTKKDWVYRVKDLQGNTVGWYTERELERIAN